MFKASRKTSYDDIYPLPKLQDVADRVRKARLLLVVSPDSKIPPEEVQKFFEGLSQKNNMCVLHSKSFSSTPRRWALRISTASRQFLEQ
jgi:hypothetical protein